jgi:hypothetical protein
MKLINNLSVPISLLAQAQSQTITARGNNLPSTADINIHQYVKVDNIISAENKSNNDSNDNNNNDHQANDQNNDNKERLQENNQPTQSETGVPRLNPSIQSMGSYLSNNVV